MRIDLIIGSLGGGGAERVVSTLANYFANNGHEVRVMTFKDGDKYPLDDNIVRKRFHQNLPFLNFSLVRALVYMLKFYWFKKNRPDIISSHIGLMGLATIPIAKLFRIKIVVSEHINHSNTPITLKKNILWHLLYKYADALTILTKYDQAFFKPKNNNVVVMHNPNSFSPLNNQNKNRSKTILAIGRLDSYEHKGFDNLIEIAKNIKKVHPDWKFMIIGEGNEGYKFLKDKINHLELNKNVILSGFRPDVDKLLQNSSIFVLSSRYEGLPMGLIEATSQGVACIAYNCVSGPSDIIDNEINGILVKNQDKNEMTNQIIRLIENQELRQTLGENALKSSHKFSVEKIGRKWEDLFKEILKKINGD